MFSIKKLDIRTWVLGSFILILSLMFVQATVDNRNEKESEVALQKEYELSTKLQVDINKLSVAYNDQLTAIKNLLLRGKNVNLYHLQLSEYYARERTVLERLDKITVLSESDDKFKLLIQNIEMEHHVLSKYFQKAIRIFNISSEQAHVFADQVLNGKDEEFIRVVTLLERASVSLQKEKVTRLLKEANERRNKRWVIDAAMALMFSLFLYIVIDKKVKELKVSEERFQLAVSGSNDGIWDWDIHSNSNYFSPRFIELLGYLKDDDFPQTMENFSSKLHPNEIERVMEEVRKHLEEHIPYNIEYQLQMKDGSYKWFLARGQAIWDENGNAVRMVGSVSDISERKKAEDALQVAYEFNEKIFSESPIGIVIYDHTGQCIAANDCAAKMVGATKEQVLQQNYKYISSWKDSGLLDVANKCVRRKEKQRHEFDVYTTFGVQAFFDCQFRPFISNGEQHLLFMLDDITERKATETSLKESEALLERAQQIAHIGHWKLDLINMDIAGSEEFYKLFGLTKHELKVAEVIAVIHEDDRSMAQTILQRAIEHGEAWDIEYRVFHDDGNKKWVHAVGEVIVDTSGSFVEAIGTVQDITELKSIENELRKNRDNLENIVNERTKELQDAQYELVRKERLATLGQLTATVSHELRNPLGAMRPSLYVIQKKSNQKDERVQKAIARVDRSIDRCDNIIDELLDFTRITELDQKITRVDEWLGSVIDEQDVPDGIMLEKNFGLNDVELAIDTDRLRRAIINVVDNACHAMMDDNQQLVKHKNALLQIKTRTRKNRVEIIISDTGKGMENDVLDKVFEPLFSTKSFGVGLGMPTIKQIVKQHNGDIDIDSKQGKGTTVTLWLPMNVSNNS